ncbi:hypothetical protein, partial [Pseudomonas edaphica]|uniref:hypothetical protein n=1 Tax=Pseudomonas edaphica TaxID=2006980 RepID=UPI00197CB707
DALWGGGRGACSPARRPYGEQVWRPDKRVQKQVLRYLNKSVPFSFFQLYPFKVTKISISKC